MMHPLSSSSRSSEVLQAKMVAWGEGELREIAGSEGPPRRRRRGYDTRRSSLKMRKVSSTICA
jgi:hypothetical protein